MLSGFGGDFRIGDSEFCGEMTVNDDGLNLRFSEPSTIDGIVVTVSENAVSIEAFGVTKRYDKDSVPEYSPALYIYGALSAAKELKPEAVKDGISILGECEYGSFTIFLDMTGLPESFVLNGIGTEVQLINVGKQNG